MSCTARGFLTSSPMLIPDTRATYLSFSAGATQTKRRVSAGCVQCAFKHEARTEDGTLELHGNASEDDVIHLEVAVFELDSPDSDNDALNVQRARVRFAGDVTEGPHLGVGQSVPVTTRSVGSSTPTKEIRPDSSSMMSRSFSLT